jgi:hypothetical protein
MPSPLPSTREGVQRTREALRQRHDRTQPGATGQGRPNSPREQALAAALRAMKTLNPQMR